MNGLLIIDKPAEMTSFDVIRKVRGRLRRVPGVPRKLKVGHAGTLDPFATGVLLLCIGVGTKLARFLTAADKTYRATVRLGEATDTEDSEGTVTATVSTDSLDDAQVRQALLAMQGPQLQTPPIYSAIHVNGQRAYDLARKGESFELEPRSIDIKRLEVLSVALPEASFDIVASKGTYIRSICRDVGVTLGVGGHCCQLRRLASSGFSIEEAVSLETVLDVWDDAQIQKHLLPPIDMLRELPLLEVDAEVTQQLRFGQKPNLSADYPPGTVLRVGHESDLVCVAEIEENGVLRPLRVMAY